MAPSIATVPPPQCPNERAVVFEQHVLSRAHRLALPSLAHEIADQVR
jgi:hypothetical protein